MAQKSSASRKGRTVSAPIDPEQPVGKHLFFDNKRRLIYVSPLLHKNLYLPKYDYKRFNRYNSRFIVAVATIMICGSALTDWFKMPMWIAFVLGALVFAGFEWSFYKFQKGLTVVSDFDPSKATPTVSSVISSDMRTKTWLKIILFIVLGVLLVVNAYQSHYSQQVIILCWCGLAVCVYMAINLLILLFRSPKE